MRNYEYLGDDLRRIYSIETVADAELDALLASAGAAIDALDIDAEPPVSDLFPRPQPNYSANLHQPTDAEAIMTTVRHYMDAWIEAKEAEREAIDRELAREEADLRKRIEDRERRDLMRF